MAILARYNQYTGINAHFQSYAPTERDGWVSFHTNFISDLTKAIDRLLPPGYEVLTERSLQIPSIESPRPQYRQPDITILATDPLSETLDRDEDDFLHAVLIWGAETGKPVTRLEVLSPTNKTSGREKYRAKRDTALYWLNSIFYMRQIRRLKA